MKRITVKLGERSYQIIISDKILSRIGSILRKKRLGRDAIIITNPKIWSLYGPKLRKTLQGDGFSVFSIKIPDKETSKSNKEAMKLIQKISRIDKKRGTFIIAFGGGVIGDLAGFVACIYKRGIPYIQIPTTLLGQVDSAIGGKVAIDLEIAKNLVGAFYQPQLVVSDISLLETLPIREIKSGFAEIIKYGVIADKNLFLFVEKNLKGLLRLDKDLLEYVIYKCSKIKSRIVERDECDTKGIRAILNYGHTVGHAIEAASKYSRLYTHGEAVAAGMVVAAEIAERLSILKKESRNRLETLLKNIGLPTKIKKLRLKDILEAQSYDKKIIHGMNRFILPTEIGRVRTYENIPTKLIADTIKKRLSD